jgi:F-type H+-transporting ATPase subunit delta
MRGASRDSLAGARDRLEDVGRSDDGAALGPVAEELFSVSALLDREGALRRALADPSLPGRTKTELARRLLDGQVGEQTMAVLDGAVSARWSRPADLLDALDELGATAMLIVAEAAGELDDVEDELFRFSRIVDREPELHMALTDQRLPLERKRELSHALLEGRARPATLRLVDEVVAHPRGRTLDAALAGYAELAAQRRQRLVATVRVAVALTEEQEDRLAAALAREFGRQVQLQVEQDPAVLGGVHVKIGDEVLDGTVAGRLAEARRRLAG